MKLWTWLKRLCGFDRGPKLDKKQLDDFLRWHIQQTLGREKHNFPPKD